MVTECIKVSTEIIKKIDKRKEVEGHTSRDSAVRSYISEAEMYKQKEKECKEKDKEIKILKEELNKLKK